jgi:hypothetical protein
MVQHRVFVFAAMVVALMAAIARLARSTKPRRRPSRRCRPTSARPNLDAGKTQFRDANYGCRTAFPQGRRELRRQCRGLDGSPPPRPARPLSRLRRRAYDQLVKLAGRVDRQQSWAFPKLLRGNKKEGQDAARSQARVATDTTVVDANLAMLTRV